MSVRRLRPEEARLWAQVARTVSPAPGMSVPEAAAPDAATGTSAPGPSAPARLAPRVRPGGPIYTRHAPRADLAAAPAAKARPVAPGPNLIEPNRKRRIVRAPEAIAARLDLHGLDQDRAKAALHAFILAAQANGARAVLVITGKGRGGSDGVLRARAPEWLAQPPVRAAIAGVSQAEQRHGGAGAFYVALKRRP